MISRVWQRIGVVLLLIWSLGPIYWGVNTSLQTDAEAQSVPAHFWPAHPTFANYQTLLGLTGPTDNNYTSLASEWLQSTVNTFIECTIATVLTVAIASIGAYAFARLHFRGRSIAFALILVTMSLPAYATLIPIYQLYSLAGLVNTYTGIVGVYVAGFLPLAIWVLYNYFNSFPPSIEEAARCDGASPAAILWHVTLPLARPGVIAVAIITFLFAWSQFLFPLVLGSDISTQPLTVAIGALQGKHVVPFTLLNAAGILALLVPAGIVLLLNRYIVSGILAGSGR